MRARARAWIRVVCTRCEGLTAQMRGLEEKFDAGEAKREEAYAKELRKQKEVPRCCGPLSHVWVLS